MAASGTMQRADGGASGRRAALILAGITLIAGALLAFLPAYPNDALYNARRAIDAGWGEILTGIGLFPPGRITWRLAVAINPAEPYVPVRVLAAALHAANVWLVWQILRRIFSARQALAGAALFALYRPGATTFLWAGAIAYLQCTFFSLAALACWIRDSQRWRWAAVGCTLMALLVASSALLLPVALAAWTLWVVDSPQSVRERFGKARGPLLSAVALSALLAVRAYTSFVSEGWTERHGFESVTFDPIAAFSALGATLFRLHALFYPRPIAGWDVIGLVTLVSSVPIFLFAPARIRFGWLWCGAFISPAIMMRSASGPGYGYWPALGAIMVLITLYEIAGERIERLVGGRRRMLVPVVALTWVALNTLLWVKDLRYATFAGTLSEQMRAVVLEHRDEILSAGGLYIAGNPPPVRPVEVIYYDFDALLPVEGVDSCAIPRQRPCLSWPGKWIGPGACEGAAARDCARWHPAPNGEEL